MAELSWEEDETRMLAAELDPGDYRMTWLVHAWGKGWESDLGSSKEPFTVTSTNYFFFDDSACGEVHTDLLEAGIDYEPTEVVVACDTGLTALYCEAIVEAEGVVVGPLLTKDAPSYLVTWTTGYTAPAIAAELLTLVEHAHFARPNPK